VALLLDDRDYDKAGNPTTLTTAGAVVTTTTYDAAGYATVQTLDPSGLNRAVTHSRNLDGTVHHSTATGASSPGRTERVDYTYDAAGRELTTTVDNTGGSPAALTTTLVRDPRGLVTRSTDPTGIATEVTYDLAGLPLTTTGAARTTWVAGASTAGVSPVTTLGRNTFGEITHLRDPSGNTTASTFDAMGRVATVTLPPYTPPGGSPITSTSTTTYNAMGLPWTQTDPLGRVTTLAYDKYGRLTSRTLPDPDGAGPKAAPVWTYAYDKVGQQLDVTDPTGAHTLATYDSLGRQVTATRSDRIGGTTVYFPTSLGYDDAGNFTAVTTPLGLTSVASYNKAGQIVRAIDPTGRLTQTGYDLAGRPVATAAGRNPSSVNLALSKPTLASSACNANEGPEKAVNGTWTGGTSDKWCSSNTDTNRWLRVDLGASRQITSIVLRHAEAGGEQSVYNTRDFSLDVSTDGTTWSAVAGVTANTAATTTHPVGLTARYVRVTVTTPTSNGNLSARIYELEVNGPDPTPPVSWVNPVRTMSYDLAGRQVSTSDCTATSSGGCSTVLRTATTAHDAAGRPTQSTSPQGRPTIYGYDTAGQLTTLTQRVDPSAPATAISVGLGYDAAGHGTRLVDGLGNATDYTYNSWGLSESTIEPSTTAHPNPSDRTWTVGYDAAGQPVQDLLPGGVSRTRTFDGLGRLTNETGAGATTVVRQLDYDPLGRLVSVSAPGANLTYTWNDRDLLTGSTGPAGGSTFGYDGDNQLLTRTDPTGTATFTYDAAGRLATMADPLTSVTATYSYDNAGRLAGIAHGTGNATRTYSYDNLGRIWTDVWATSGGSTQASAIYLYDNDDLLTSKTTFGVAGAGSNGYTYDGLSRLATWTNPSSQITSYGYDAASNRTGVSNSGGTQTTTFDQRNRPLTAAGGGQPSQSWTWSPRGTMATETLGGVTTTYTFDAFERLVSVAGASAVTYAYDGLDRLATRNGISLGYADLTNSPVKNPTSGADALISRTPTGIPFSTKIGAGAAQLTLTDPVHADASASAAVTGTLSASTSYDPWGTVAASSGTSAVGFQGGFTDPTTGQVNAHARWYAPGLGSFTSRDTYTLAPNPIAQANRYLYANGNPTTGRDPDGHMRLSVHQLMDAQEKAKPKVVRDRAKCEARGLCDPEIPRAEVVRFRGGTELVHVANLDYFTVNGVQFSTDMVTNPYMFAFYVDVNLVSSVGGNTNRDDPEWVAFKTKQAMGATCASEINIHLQCTAEIYEINAEFAYEASGCRWQRAAGRACETSKFFAWMDENHYELIYGDEATSGVRTESGLNNGGVRTVASTTRVASPARQATPTSQASQVRQAEVSVRGEQRSGEKCSFTPDTRVVMADGSTARIADVEVGDHVVATDADSGVTSDEVVTALHVNDDLDLTDVTLVDDDGQLVVLHTTQNHPFWDATDRRWVAAGELVAGHEVHSDHGPIRVVAVHDFAEHRQMHNLTVNAIHTYYVQAGGSSVLVHNQCPIAGHTGAPVDIRTAPDGCTCPKMVILGPDGRPARPGGTATHGVETPSTQQGRIEEQRTAAEAHAQAVEAMQQAAANHDWVMVAMMGLPTVGTWVKMKYQRVRDWWMGESS
jgi:RHS repeat-associated protein